MKNVSFIAICALTAACGAASKTTKQSTNAERWQYEYSENGCSTGERTGETKAEQCTALADDALNNHCARTLREKTYLDLCGGALAANGGGEKPKVNEENPEKPRPTKKVCGYDFAEMADTTAVRGALQGTWVTRRTGVATESGSGTDRTYKDGLFLDFTGGELSEVRVYHELDGATFEPVAMSLPGKASSIKISEAMPSGTYKGWHLVQWTTPAGRCSTIAVGLERRANELEDTLLVLGPASFYGEGDVEAPKAAAFFENLGSPRNFTSLGLSALPRWTAQGL